MTDKKDMQFINHIFSKHRIPAALIVTSVLMLVVNFISTSFASTSYDPAETLDPAYGPGDAFVQLSTSPFEDTGSLIRQTDFNSQYFVFGSDSLLGAGSKFLFDYDQGAFRAGIVEDTQWDTLGLASAAFGIDNIASGVGSTAFGYSNEASGESSTAFGSTNIASGDGSTAFGLGIAVSGLGSVGIALDNDGPYTVSNDSVMSIMGGDVGIGTVAPSERLEVVGGVTKTTGGLVIQICSNESGTPCDGSSYQDGQIWIDTTP